MWYAVNLLFEGLHAGSPPSQNLWEERLILLEAVSEEAVLKQAETLGKDEEHEYVAANGDPVRWVFRRVERVHPIEENLQSGAELFSRFLRASEVASLLTPFQQAPESVPSQTA